MSKSISIYIFRLQITFKNLIKKGFWSVPALAGMPAYIVMCVKVKKRYAVKDSSELLVYL